MKIEPLTLLHRRHTNGTPISAWTIAALHWPWSITWRWVMSYSTPYHMRPFWPRASYRPTYRGHPDKQWSFQFSVHVPWVGSINVEAQPNMPWGGARA